MAGLQTLQMLSSLIPKMTQMTAAPSRSKSSGGGPTASQQNQRRRQQAAGGTPMPMQQSATRQMPTPPPSGGGGAPSQGGMMAPSSQGFQPPATTSGGGSAPITFDQNGNPVQGGQYNNAGQPIAGGGGRGGGGNPAILNQRIDEAQQKVNRWNSNDLSLSEIGRRRSQEPKDRQELLVAEQNKQDYISHQAAIANEQNARQIAQVVSSQFGLAEGDRAYKTIMADPSGKAAEEAFKMLAGDTGAKATENRANTREDLLKNRETADRVQALTDAGVDPQYISAFGREADEDSMVSVMEFLRKQKADDIESVDAKFALKKAERLALDDVNNAMRQTERSLDMVSDWSTGLAGWALEKVAGTDSTNLAGLLDTQKAYVAFRELMEMRQASKTGGALGNVSNREIELLYNSFASLNKDSDKEVLQTSLNDILMSTAALQFGLENEQKYQDMYTSGEMTMDDAYDAMDKAQSDYTNEYMAQRTNAPQEALDELYATKGKDQRAAINEFEKSFGWRPRL
jgi:hypothetical protein